MKKIAHTLMSVAILFPIFTACSGSKSVKVSSTYTARLGLATTRDFFDESIPILTRYNFLIEKTEGYGNTIYIETRWRVGSPLKDEAEIGALESRSRVILRAKARQAASRSNLTSRLNQIVLTAENEVRFDETEKWTKIPLSNMRREFFKRISDQLKFEFSTGLRVR
jgi:hypothetical protein